MKHSTNKVQLFCEQCGKGFTRYQSQIARKGQGRFCSKDCMEASRRHGTFINCEYCGKRFYRRFGEQGNSKNQFCSKTCYQTYRFEQIKPTTYVKRFGRHEHIIVAENVLGRKLHKGAVVHHIDGNRHNNKADNLAVIPNQSIHNQIHFDKVSVDKYRIVKDTNR